MRDSAKKMARSAVAAALGFGILYLASVLPAARLAVLCVASVCVVLVQMSCGWKWALGCWAATALLSLLLLPSKGTAAVYAAFLGYYPLVKLAAERIGKPLLRWGCKILAFNAAFAALFFLGRALLADVVTLTGWNLLLVFLAGNAAFLVYDYALTQVILIYIRKIDRRIK